MTSDNNRATEYYDAIAADYNLLHHVACGGAAWVLKHQTWPRLRRSLNKSDAILEIGAGSGFLTSLLLSHKYDVISGDVSYPMLRVNLRQNPSHRAIVFDSEKIPFHGGAFDCVVGNNTFYLYKNKKRVLENICFVLKPGGRLILSEMNPYFPFWYIRRPNDKNLTYQIEFYGRLLDVKKECLEHWMGSCRTVLRARSVSEGSFPVRHGPRHCPLLTESQLFRRYCPK